MNVVNEHLEAGDYSIGLKTAAIAYGTYLCKMEIGKKRTSMNIVIR